MTIDYLGQTFKGDLLPNGQIKSQETGMFFKNPSDLQFFGKTIYFFEGSCNSLRPPRLWLKFPRDLEVFLKTPPT